MATPILKPKNLRLIGRGLRRPEGVCVTPDGAVWAADGNALVSRIDANGDVCRFGPKSPLPNGICAQSNGKIIVTEYLTGDLIRVDPENGACVSLLREVDGRKISAPNYPAVDLEGRIWCSNSTDESLDNPEKCLASNDGYLFVYESDGSSRVVAEGLCYPNGLAFSPNFDYIYVVESAARRVLRGAVLPGGRVGSFEQYGPIFDAVPDGIAFDEAHNLWVTLLIDYDALVVIDPNCTPHTVIRDAVLGGPTNIAFGGEDMRDIYIGSLNNNGILHARVETPGIRLAALLES